MLLSLLLGNVYDENTKNVNDRHSYDEEMMIITMKMTIMIMLVMMIIM